MPAKRVMVLCRDCRRWLRVEDAIEVHCTADGGSTFECPSCHANPDWRDCDPQAK